jgi:small subunit ribosomal protein S9
LEDKGVEDNWVMATGRRKTAIARVMVKNGKGKITINGKTPNEFFPTENDVALINQPLEVSDNRGKWEFQIKVQGGGTSGQAGAVLHGIARALAEADPDSRPALHKSGFLTRDSRMVERKKSGRPKARKKFQFSKR